MLTVFSGQTIKDCVITVPVYFTQSERKAVLHAAQLVDLNILQLMSDNAAGKVHVSTVLSPVTKFGFTRRRDWLLCL